MTNTYDNDLALRRDDHVIRAIFLVEHTQPEEALFEVRASRSIDSGFAPSLLLLDLLRDLHPLLFVGAPPDEAMASLLAGIPRASTHTTETFFAKVEKNFPELAKCGSYLFMKGEWLQEASTPNTNEATKLYKLAGELGQPCALNNLGYCYQASTK